LKKRGNVTACPSPIKDATTQQIQSFTYENEPIYVCSKDATRAIAVASSKGAILPRKTGFCCIVASFLESSQTTPMRNGEYESTYQKEVVKQLKLINALLLDHADHASDASDVGGTYDLRPCL
jgi:hypothetical protein